MGIDDRDYMRERDKSKDWSMGTRRVSQSSNGERQWFSKVVVWLVTFLILFTVFKKLDNRGNHKPERASVAADFPITGEVRWFIATSDEPGRSGPLTITGFRDARSNVIVRLDNWDTRTLVAMIPIRGGETASIQVPLGRYRLMYSANPAWHGETQLFGDVQETVEPLEFYRTGAQVIGHTVDLNNRPDGNLKTKPAGFFSGQKSPG